MTIEIEMTVIKNINSLPTIIHFNYDSNSNLFTSIINKKLYDKVTNEQIPYNVNSYEKKVEINTSDDKNQEKDSSKSFKLKTYIIDDECDQNSKIINHHKKFYDTNIRNHFLPSINIAYKYIFNWLIFIHHMNKNNILINQSDIMYKNNILINQSDHMNKNNILINQSNDMNKKTMEKFLLNNNDIIKNMMTPNIILINLDLYINTQK